jgi:hypothetical protein
VTTTVTRRMERARVAATEGGRRGEGWRDGILGERRGDRGPRRETMATDDPGSATAGRRRKVNDGGQASKTGSRVGLDAASEKRSGVGGLGGRVVGQETWKEAAWTCRPHASLGSRCAGRPGSSGSLRLTHAHSSHVPKAGIRPPLIEHKLRFQSKGERLLRHADSPSSFLPSPSSHLTARTWTEGRLELRCAQQLAIKGVAIRTHAQEGSPPGHAS